VRRSCQHQYIGRKATSRIVAESPVDDNGAGQNHSTNPDGRGDRTPQRQIRSFLNLCGDDAQQSLSPAPNQRPTLRACTASPSGVFTWWGCISFSHEWYLFLLIGREGHARQAELCERPDDGLHSRQAALCEWPDDGFRATQTALVERSDDGPHGTQAALCERSDDEPR
jgi:hypothetical protein